MTDDWNDPRGSAPAALPGYPGGIAVVPTIRDQSKIDPAFLYGAVARGLHDLGWSCVSQTRKEDRRQPGSLPGSGMIKYKETYELHRRMPTEEILKQWLDYAAGLRQLNTAGVTGDSPGDHGWFSLDLDVLDAALARKVEDLAVRMLGLSPFRRGRASSPKIALIYTRALGALRLAKRFVFQAHFDGQKQAIEIQDDGGLITLYGYHHKTQERFLWLGSAEPFTAPPSAAPRVDEQQILDFIGAVHAVSPIEGYDRVRKEYNAAPVMWADSDIGDVRVPPMSDELERATKLTSGRKDWIKRRSIPWARMNAGLVAPLVAGQRVVSPQGIATVAAAMLLEAEPHISLSPGDPSLNAHNAHRKVSGFLKWAASRIADGTLGFDPIGTRKLNPVTLKVEPIVLHGVVQTDDEYSWLPPSKARKKLEIENRSIIDRTPPDAETATAVELVMDRYDIERRVAEEIRAAIMAWLDAVWAWKRAKGDAPLPSYLLRAPTGSGKTTTLLKVLGEWKQRHPGARLGPILMLLPGYSNIDEVAGREDLGVWTSEDEAAAQELDEDAKAAGLRTMIYRGKLAAGCKEEEKMKLLQSGGMSGAGLCESVVMEESEVAGFKVTKPVTRFCRHHPDSPDLPAGVKGCGAILQQLEVPLCDLILAPHSFLTTNIPAALKDVTAVVVDEKVWDKTLGVRFFPLETFILGRPEPVLTKAEKAAGNVDPVSRVHARGLIGKVIVEALMARQDLSAAVRNFVDHGYRDPKYSWKNTPDQLGPQLLEEALWVTGRLQRVVMEINPDTSLSDITTYLKSSKTKNLIDEHLVLKLIDERLQAAIEADKPGYCLRPGGAPDAPRGDTDARIQLVDGGTTVRVSWRRSLNFTDLPIMFLDASGSKKMLEKIWARTIKVHDIDAPLFVRCVWMPGSTYAKSRLVPAKDDDAKARLGKAANQVMLREGLTAVSMMHGDGAVVAAMPLSVRRHLQAAWCQPSSLHFMHYGNVRGIDYAKNHTAAFSIGQLELSPKDLDAYVGALTFDDLVPERPTDYFGNGRDGDGDDAKQLVRRYADRKQKLRDGGVATIKVFEPEGEWALLVVKQIREEELSQFLGRLRPVHRSGRAPTWYHCGQVLPEHVVVDEIIALEDLARPFGRTKPIFHELSVGSVLTEGGLGCFHMTGVTDKAVRDAHAAIAANPRSNRSFYELEYFLEGDKEAKSAFVPGYAAPTPAAAGELVVDRVFGAQRVRVVREPRFARFAVPRPDKVEIELGEPSTRAEVYMTAMSDLFAREEWKQIVYDTGRSGIKIGKTTQVPHLFVAFEMLSAKVEELRAAAQTEAPAVIENVTPAQDEEPAPVAIAFKSKMLAPTPANSATPVPDLGENVVHFRKPSSFVPFGVAAISRSDATAS